MTTRDWKWIVSVLSGVIIGILSYKFWGKPGNLTEVISIGSGLASIALAIAAIVYSVAEGVKASVKEGKVDVALNTINRNLNSMEKLINKLDKDLTETSEKVSKFEESYARFYASLQNESSTLGKENEEEKNPSPSGEVNEEKNQKEKPTTSIESSEKVVEPQERHKDKVNSKAETKIKTSSLSIRRGDILFADLSSVVGSEQGGNRPVLVIQNDVGNRFSPTITVAAITTQINKAKLPTHVELENGRYGLDRDCVILLEQLRTIDKSRIQGKIGSIDEIDMKKVEDALYIQMGLYNKS